MSTAENLKQLQSERTRALLVDAAADLMLRKGYSGTTISLLAGATGMTKGAIYHHFENKEGILRAVLARVRSTWEQQVGARMPSSATALAQLEALFDNQAHLINADPSLCLLVNGLMLESEALNDRIAAEIGRIYEDLSSFVQGILDRGQAAGMIRSDLSSAALARSIVAIVSGISCSRESDRSDESFACKMQTTKAVVLSGIRA